MKTYPIKGIKSDNRNQTWSLKCWIGFDVPRLDNWVKVASIISSAMTRFPLGTLWRRHSCISARLFAIVHLVPASQSFQYRPAKKSSSASPRATPKTSTFKNRIIALTAFSPRVPIISATRGTWAGFDARTKMTTRLMTISAPASSCS